MTNSTEVKQFYNDFTNTKMLNYKLYGNPRIDKAIELIANYVKSNSQILDLGCGIGIVPEQVATKLDGGKILACDLSDNNINYARKTISSDKIEFLNVNVVENFEVIKNKLSQPVDLVTIIDVIEHLPPDSYERLFTNLSQVTAADAHIILTYPSPEYQMYLREHEPQKLQIIDEVIKIESLIGHALQFGFNLKYFSYIDLWCKNQYIHCVFAKNLPLEPIKSDIRSEITNKFRYYKSKILAPYLKYRYIDRPSKE